VSAFDRSAARRPAVVIAVGALAAAVLAPWGRPASADGPPPAFSTFTASASAAPLALELVDSGAPVIPGGQVLYATPTFSRADLDSVGNSTGLAAAPFPGDAIPALMGAANGASPTGPVFPPYPFTVTSRYPGEPEAAQARGPETLKATSSEHGSDGDAYVGLARGNPGIASVASTSNVKHDPATGEVTAQATGVIDGLALDQNVVINHIAGHAQISARPGQPIVKQTAFSVGTMTVGGQTVGFTDKGFVPADGAKPGPDIGALTKQLSAAGITFAFVPARETDNSVDSAGLAIGYSREVPNVGVMKVTLTLGRVTAKVEAAFDTPSPSGGSVEYTEAEGSASGQAPSTAQPALSQPLSAAGPTTAGTPDAAIPETASSASAASEGGLQSQDPSSSVGSSSYAPLYAPAGAAPSSGSLGEPITAGGGSGMVGFGTGGAAPMLAMPVRASHARTGGVYGALCFTSLFVLVFIGLYGRGLRAPAVR